MMGFLFLSVLLFCTLLPLVQFCICFADIWISTEIWLEVLKALGLLLLSVLLFVSWYAGPEESHQQWQSKGAQSLALSEFPGTEHYAHEAYLQIPVCPENWVLVVEEGAKFNCVTGGCSQVGSYTPVPGYSQARLGDGLRVACSVRQQDSFPKLSWGCPHCLGFSCWLLCWTGLVVNAEFRFPWQVLFSEIYSSAAFICQANALECRLTIQMWNLSSRKENKGLNVF